MILQKYIYEIIPHVYWDTLYVNIFSLSNYVCKKFIWMHIVVIIEDNPKKASPQNFFYSSKSIIGSLFDNSYIMFSSSELSLKKNSILIFELQCLIEVQFFILDQFHDGNWSFLKLLRFNKRKNREILDTHFLKHTINQSILLHTSV